jgi:hypothetical protein
MCQEGKAKSCRLKKILEFLEKNSPNPLDKWHKMCYNEYVRWGTPTAKTTKDRGTRHDAMDFNRPAKASGGEM